MIPPTHPFLLQIQGLDRNAPDLPQQLDKILHEPEYEECVEGLEGRDLVWFVEYLDGVLDNLEDDLDIVSRKCMRELGRVCRDKKIFPTSFQLDAGSIEIPKLPFASGNFGDVYHGTLDGKTICVKRLKLYAGTDSKIRGEFHREAVMWKYLKHPNVLPFLGATTEPPQLVSELMPDGNLKEYLGKNPNADKLGLLLDITKGLDYLHSRNVIHGDLKPENIVVDVDEKTKVPRACIMDLGTAIVTQGPQSRRPATGQGARTPHWTAPEGFQAGVNLIKASDVFSFAMITIEVFTGHIPFGDISEWVVATKIMVGDRPPRPEHSSCTDDLWAMIQRCWDQDAGLRPEISEVSTLLSSLTRVS